MNKIELISTNVSGNTIQYQVREEGDFGLLQKEVVDLFIRFHGNDNFNFDLNQVPRSILMLPISLYMIPITYFYNVELVIPEMDKVLYDSLSKIYEAYSKIYGPFKEEWKGKITVGKIIDNKPIENPKYNKVVFFSGGVDACHAGIDNPGKESLLVSIPDIEVLAQNDGPLREEKFALIKKFSKVVNSDWLLISNNFNVALYKNEEEINKFLYTERGLCSPAFKYDGWGGIRYLPNMCCVAPIAYVTGITSLVMGSTYEQIEDKKNLNLDGANPILSDAIRFANISFAEQDALMVRRTKKVINIINWCKAQNVKTKMWVCFSDGSTQCGFCNKCIRTQLNILCAKENPKEWGFENFSEKNFSTFVKSYRYIENPCWLWDNIETIEDDTTYPFCNDLLHWLKKIGYKKYGVQAKRRVLIRMALSIHKYPYYLRIIGSRLIYRK